MRTGGGSAQPSSLNPIDYTGMLMGSPSQSRVKLKKAIGAVVESGHLTQNLKKKIKEQQAIISLKSDEIDLLKRSMKTTKV